MRNSGPEQMAPINGTAGIQSSSQLSVTVFRATELIPADAKASNMFLQFLPGMERLIGARAPADCGVHTIRTLALPFAVYIDHDAAEGGKDFSGTFLPLRPDAFFRLSRTASRGSGNRDAPTGWFQGRLQREPQPGV